MPAPFLPPYVKVYVDQPLGYIPFVAPGGRFNVDIRIEMSGIIDNSAEGIVDWGMTVCFDPDVLELGRVVTGTFGYLLFDFADGWLPPIYEPQLTIIPPPPEGGCWDISEVIVPTPPGGAGDPWSGWKLVTLQFKSKSDTQSCLIDLKNVEYMTPDGAWHSVDVVIDGFYGAPPSYMSETSGTYDPTQDPVGTMWHELYPNYSHMWDLTKWTDNGDGHLSASDQIEMVNETGWTYPFHVDAVTTTIHWTFKPDGINPTGDLRDAEPNEPHLIDDVMRDPVGSYWHQIYPEYSRWFKITSWEDNGDGVFSISDQFDFIYEDDSTTYWAHLDAVTTDMLLSQKGPPEPPPVPEFPIGLAFEILFIPVIIYTLWRNKQRKKLSP